MQTVTIYQLIRKNGKKMNNANTSDEPHTSKTLQQNKYTPGSEQRGAILEKKEILQDRQLPISLKRQVMDQCVLTAMTYGCQTWSLNKQLTNKLTTDQRAMERKMWNLKINPMLRDQKKNKDNCHYSIHAETKFEMDRTYSKNEGQ